MRAKKIINYLFLIQMLYSSGLFAQSPGAIFNLKQMLPSSPEAAALGKFGDIPVGMYTGTADISIPLYTIKEAGIEVPINLSYHGSGIKVEDEATNVGLGWSLEPGGSVIQIVNGKNVEPDPINSIDHAGYLYTLSQGQQSFYFERDPIGMFGYNCYTASTGDQGDSQAILTALSQGFGQPDIFQYNFGGFSGKFYINPQTAQPVLLDKKSNLTFVCSPTSIVATTMDGNIFTFDVIETSGADVFTDYTGRTFKLSKIQLHTGKTILFSYLDGYYQSSFYNETFRTDYPANKSDGYTNKVEPHSDYAEHYTKMLSSITTDKVIVNFNLEDRIDLNANNSGSRLPAKRIGSIDITDSLSGQKIKSYKFTYDYFTSPTPNSVYSYLATANGIGGTTIANTALKRLKLLSVQEAGYNQSQQPVLNPPYTFAYNERMTMPDKGNYSRDYWGFYNGKPNTKLMPDLSFFYFSDDQDYQSMPATVVSNINGANRAPDSAMMKALVLEKITYPTGGFSEFDYEPHVFSNHIYPDVERVAAAARSALLNDHNMAGDVRTTTFTLPATQSITFHISIAKGNNSALTFYDLEPSYITFSKTVGGTTTVIKTWQMFTGDKAEFDANGGYFARDESIAIPYTAGATYTVTCDLPDALGTQTTGMALVSAHFNYYQPSTYTNSYGGGLRIAAVRNYSAAGAPAIKKTYKYINANGTSSGIMMSPYKPLNNRVMYGVQLLPGSIPKALGSNILTWFGSSESLIPYSDAAGGNIVGYTRVEESETAADGSVNGKHVSFYNNVASNAHPNVPDDPNLLNGMISRDEIYANSTSMPISATDYSYNSLAFSYYAGIKSMSTFVGDEPTGCPNDYGPDNFFWSQVKKWKLYFYPLHSEWYMLSGKTTTENFNGQALTTTHTYNYNAIGQMSGDAMTNSKGQALTTNYTYPYDIPDANRTPAQVSLIFRKLYNSIIKVQNFNATTLESADYITYDDVNLQLVRTKIEHAIANNPLYTEYTFDDYGSYKTLKQVSEKGLKPSALLWNDNKAYIIAEAANATSPDVAYTSFEPNQAGNWTIASTARNNTGFTGAKSYSMASGTVSKTGLTAAITYTVSYWTQNATAYTISGTTTGYPIKGQTINGWTYYEHRVTGITTVTISGTGNIDELRLYPAGAQMTSYTYDQVQGITSTTDAKNQVSYYEYDPFRRLMNIKDKDGNIIKHMDYHYQQ